MHDRSLLLCLGGGEIVFLLNLAKKGSLQNYTKRRLFCHDKSFEDDNYFVVVVDVVVVVVDVVVGCL